MGCQPADAGGVGEQERDASEDAEAAQGARRQGQQSLAAQEKHSGAEPKDDAQRKQRGAERVPVQGFPNTPVGEADKRAGQPAAGAGQAGQMVKQADRRERPDLPARAARQGEQGGSGQNRRQQQAGRAGIGPAGVGKSIGSSRRKGHGVRFVTFCSTSCSAAAFVSAPGRVMYENKTIEKGQRPCRAGTGRQEGTSMELQWPLLECWLSADLESVPPARKKAMRVCTEAGLTEDDCFALDIALGEALANAVTHGAGAGVKTGEEIYLGMWNFQSRLIIQVRDSGPGFTPPGPPYLMPDAAQQATRGRGLPLMETLTDALAVCRGCAAEGGASVFLIKSMPSGRN